MKKNLRFTIIAVIVAILAISLILYFAIPDKEEPPTLKETVDSRISAYETDLTDSIGSMKDVSSVQNYLTNWAEHKEIDYTSDNAGNIIFSIDADKDYEKQSPVVIICPYSPAFMENYINSFAAAFTIAKNDMPHGSYKIIFTCEDSGAAGKSGSCGADELSKTLFPDGSDVFYFLNTETSRIAIATGGRENASITRPLTMTSPTYDKAYKITISGLPHQRFTSESADAPNPVKVLGNQLASFKSSSTLFELAEIKGGYSSDVLPQDASMTVLVSDDSSSKFEDKMESAIEKFYDKFSEDYPEIQYTCEPADVPEAVISQDDTEAIVSLLYTSLCGVHYKDDEGEISSMTNLGSIKTSDSRFQLSLAAFSWDKELLNEISESYETICGLSGFSFNLNSQQPPYAPGEAISDLESDFREAYADYQNTKLDSLNMADYTACYAIQEKNPKIKILPLGLSDKTRDNFAGAVITYLQSSGAGEDGDKTDN